MSDDKVLPPPPNARRKRTLSGDQGQSLPAKSSCPGSSPSKGQSINPGTSTAADAPLGPGSFQIVDQSRKKKLPAGVTPIPKRTTPRRAAKDKAKGQEITSQDELMSEESGSGSASEDDGAGSDKMVVGTDWVIMSSVQSMSLIISLLIPFSTTLSLLITDLSKLCWFETGRLIAKSRLIISQCIVIVVLS